MMEVRNGRKLKKLICDEGVFGKMLSILTI